MSAHASDAVATMVSARALRGAASAPVLDTSVYERALAGETVTGLATVEGVAAGKGYGVAVIPAPVASVWKAVNSEDDFERFGELAVSDVVSGSPHTSGNRLFQFMELPLVADRWWVAKELHNAALYGATNGAAWEVYWTSDTDPKWVAGTAHEARIAGAVPVSLSDGAWLLVAVDDGHTLAEYYSWSDPGGSLPAGPASRFAVGAIKTLFKNVGLLAGELADAPGYFYPDGAPMPGPG